MDPAPAERRRSNGNPLNSIAVALIIAALQAPPALAQTDPRPAGPALGQAHLRLKFARADFDDTAAELWGVDDDSYLGLEICFGGDSGVYFGSEIGQVRVDDSRTADGDQIRDFDFYSLEFNAKQVFRLPHGFSVGVGAGSSIFYVDGDEVFVSGGQEFADPLADLGFGLQAFADLTWRTRRLLIGLEVKYQYAFDILALDYSNLRLGGHLGVVF